MYIGFAILIEVGTFQAIHAVSILYLDTTRNNDWAVRLEQSSIIANLYVNW